MNAFEPKQFGKYYLVEKLAVGGMAEIYKAKTFGVDGFEKLLVIKRILPHCAADKDFITMLIDEAKLSVLLSHANIVQVFDLGRIGDDYFIAMEYIHGLNLRDVMYRCREIQKPISPEIAVYIISEICKGLDYAHRKTDSNGGALGIVHRDISPQNILLSYEGEVKIVDFGIAKAAMNISHTMAGILKGKIAYMSPEQATGRTTDYRTDIFSAGILLYEMLTNSKLFTGESQFEVLKKIRSSKIDEAKLPNTIADALKPAVAKALAYRVEDRYVNAGDMQLDLTKYLYSTYIDFSPRKLAAFIKETFAAELKEEQIKKAQIAGIESQTASMNIKEGAKQVEIVHKDDSLTAVDKTREVSIAEEESEVTETPVAEKPQEIKKKPRASKEPKSPGEAKKWRKLMYPLAAFVVLVTVLYGAYRYIPAVRFWEKKPELPQIEIFGVAKINSTPEKANIFINGEDTGFVTPHDFDDLKLNKAYAFRIVKENYKPAETAVRPISKEPEIVNITLQEIGGVLNIISDPAGAAIILDGRTTGSVTPATVEDVELDKDHKIILSKPQYEDYEQVVNLKSRTPQKISAVLKPVVLKTGTISVASVPEGATIFLNEKDTGRFTPSSISNLNLNEIYTVKLIKEGHELWNKTLTLSDSEPVVVTGQLKATGKSVSTEPTTTPPADTKEKEQVGSVKITSDPAGAAIFLDGKATGKNTPAVIDKLVGGKKYTVAMELEGFERLTRRVTAVASKETAVVGKLKQIVKPTIETQKTPPSEPPEKTKETVVEPSEVGKGSAEIKISSNPSDAQVFINSEFKGKTPLSVSVPSGSVSVLISKEGYARYSKKINVKAGEKLNLSNINLGDVYGEVILSSSPPRASVVFDGQAIPAKTPVTVRKVRRDQSHSVSISLKGYKTWTRSFTMEEGSKSFDVVLEEE